MLRLRTLGGISLDGASRPLEGAAVQRRRLALLAVIAAGGARGVSRERLLGLLWPERSEARARHALAQALYALRRALGDDALIVAQHDICLNPLRITTDLWELEEALEAGAPDRVVALYTGAFLDGVYVDDAPAFEQWMDVERERLRRAYSASLASLAATAESRGDTQAAVEWWRRLARAEPLAEAPALGLMRALAHAGDAPAALQHARHYASHLRTELDVAPGPEVTALVERLRSGSVPVRRTPPAHVAPAGTRPSTNAVLPVSSAVVPSTTTDTAEAPTGEVSRARESNSHASNSEASNPEASHSEALKPRALSTTVAPRRVSWRRVSVAVGCAALAVLAALSRSRLTRASGTTVDGDRIAVFPFAARTDSADAFLGEGMVDLLSTALDGAGRLRAVDRRVLLYRAHRDSTFAADPQRAARAARALGAGLFVLGAVTAAGDRIQVDALLYDASVPSKPPAEGTAVGQRSELFNVVERIAAQLLAQRSPGPAERLARDAALTAHSLPALKAYLSGESAMRGWRFGDAFESFQRAVAIDTSFALGHYRLSIAADWMGRGDLVDSSAARAVRFGAQLSARDRELAEALLEWRRGDADAAERRYRRILLHYPDDVETWYQLGEVLFHDNPWRGRSFAEARMPFERALALEPDAKQTLLHLMRIAAWNEDWETAGALLRRIGPGDQDPHLAPYVALATRDTAALTASIEALRSMDGGSVLISAVRLELYTHRLDLAERLLSLLIDARRPVSERAAGQNALAFLAATRGRWREARARMDSVRALRPRFGLEAWARLALVPTAPLSTRELTALRDTVLRWRRTPIDSSGRALFEIAPAEFPLRFAAIAGLLASRLDDSAGVAAAVRALEADTSSASPWMQRSRDAHLLILRAESDRIAGRPSAPPAIAEILRGTGQDEMRDAERYLAGEILRAAGRPAEAARWFNTFEQTGTQGLPWAAPGHLARGELLARAGRRAEAVAEFERVVELWSGCDPELRALRDGARRRAREMRALE